MSPHQSPNDPMYQVDIANNQSCLKLAANYVRKVVRQTLKLEEVVEANISVAIVDDAAIHDVNRRFLKHDSPTDVISFLFQESGGASMSATDQATRPRGAGKTIAGEIVVSAETAVSMAQDIGWSATEELTLYLVHGLLHVCGYDDLKKSELKVMRARERVVMESLGLNIPPRDDEQPTAKKKAAIKRTTSKAKGATS